MRSPAQWNVIYQRVGTDSDSWSFQDPEIWETLNGERHIVIFGGPARLDLNADTRVINPGVFPFWGRFIYCAATEPDDYPECEVPELWCESTAHTLTVLQR